MIFQNLINYSEPLCPQLENWESRVEQSQHKYLAYVATVFQNKVELSQWNVSSLFLTSLSLFQFLRVANHLPNSSHSTLSYKAAWQMILCPEQDQFFPLGCFIFKNSSCGKRQTHMKRQIRYHQNIYFF